MWKKSKIWESKAFRVLIILEAVLLLIGIWGLFPGNRVAVTDADMEFTQNAGTYTEANGGYFIDGSYGFQGEYLKAGGFSLKPGVYQLKIYYESVDNDVNNFVIESENGSFQELLSNNVSLYSGIGERNCQFYVRNKVDSARIIVNYMGTEALTVKGFEIVHTTAGSRIFLFLLIILSAVINTLAMLYAYLGKYTVETEKKLVWFGIPAITVLASLPLFTDYMMIGADSIFHWVRIEALAQSILEGALPARIESMWLYGQGYASSIFYCDTFLMLPALLRLIGFHMDIAYGMYVFAVNLATAWIAYACFKGCFHNRYIGMFGAMLYTLAPYRIYNIYNRCAVGEYTALTFLPLLCYGFYLLFTEDVHKKEYKYYWILPMLGFSGIIQSHVLTCEIAGGFTILLCILLIKKVFRKQTFLALVKVVAGTILMNLWFLVPFLDLMMSGEYRFSQNTGTTIQERGILPAHFFYTMQSAGNNSRFHELGLQNTEPIGVGIAILIGTAAFCLIRKKQRDRARAAWAALVLGVTALVMSTCYFPWNWIQSWNKITGTLVPMIQFPTRLTVIPTVCLTFVACVAAYWLLKDKNKWLKNVFFLLTCGSCIIFSMYQTNDTLLSKEGMIRLYSAEAIGHSGVLGAEYLPIGAEMTFSYHDAVPSPGVTVSQYQKENLDVTMELSVSENSSEYVELPMLYYKGYQAKDTVTGDVLQVIPGDNYVVRVLLPAGYQGTIRTWYAGMWYWRLAEGISAAALLGLFAILYKRHKDLMN